MVRTRSAISSRPVILALAAFVTITLFLSLRPSATSEPHGSERWQFAFDRDANSHSLTAAQCDATFPRLFEKIDDAVLLRERSRNWVLPQDLEIPPGRCMLRVMIYEGELRIVDLGQPLDCYVSNGRERIMATLSLIQRALTSAPEPIPNVEFPISYDDMPTRSTGKVVWGFTRKQDQDVWLIPDYGYWSWWAMGLSSFKSVWRQIKELEAKYSWSQKITKAVWRGTTGYNAMIRDKLVDIAKETVWGDVKTIAHGEEDDNFLTLYNHCKYQYLLHAEGTSYSGRLKFLQLCRSVIVAHKMDWSEFATHLMRAKGPEQNFIEVERDWSDLPQKMKYFTSHPQEAEAIAERSYQIFSRRCLTPAGVSCYLRRLFHNWAKVQGFEPEILESKGDGKGYKLRGLPFEALAVSFPQERPGEYGKFAPI